MGRELIAYYSRRGQNLVGGALQNLAVGNTEMAAGMLRVLTQADLFRIEPVRDYSPDFCRCIDEAWQDLLRGARLELKAWPERWEEYDTVYLGYPNHWNTLPVAVRSFVEGLDWTRSIYNGGSTCLINRDVTTNNVTDTSNPLTVQRMRQACKDVLCTGVNSRGHAPENLTSGLMSWQIILIVVDVVLAAAVIALEVVIFKNYKKKKAAAAK